MRKLSYSAKKTIAIVLGILAALCLANYYADLGWFGRYAGEVTAIVFVLVFIDMAYIGPSISEVEKHRALKEGKDVAE